MSGNPKDWTPRRIGKVAVSIGRMSWPALDNLADLEWQLRYGNPEAVRFAAASVVAAYQQMVRDPRTKRDAVIRCLRRAEAMGNEVKEMG